MSKSFTTEDFARAAAKTKNNFLKAAFAQVMEELGGKEEADKMLRLQVEIEENLNE